MRKTNYISKIILIYIFYAYGCFVFLMLYEVPPKIRNICFFVLNISHHIYTQKYIMCACYHIINSPARW